MNKAAAASAASWSLLYLRFAVNTSESKSFSSAVPYALWSLLPSVAWAMPSAWLIWWGSYFGRQLRLGRNTLHELRYSTVSSFFASNLVPSLSWSSLPLQRRKMANPSWDPEPGGFPPAILRSIPFTIAFLLLQTTDTGMSRASRRLTFDSGPSKRPRETENHDDSVEAKRGCVPEPQAPWDVSQALEHLAKAGLHDIIQVHHSKSFLWTLILRALVMFCLGNEQNSSSY